CAEKRVSADLLDGGSIAGPIAWYPRLANSTAAERANWRLIGRGEGIHWPDLDEDISVDNLLTGSRSGESQASFKKWLASRQAAVERSVPLTGARSDAVHGVCALLISA